MSNLGNESHTSIGLHMLTTTLLQCGSFWSRQIPCTAARWISLTRTLSLSKSLPSPGLPWCGQCVRCKRAQAMQLPFSSLGVGIQSSARVEDRWNVSEIHAPLAELVQRIFLHTLTWLLQQSQAVALEDSHLMVIKRSAVEAIINKGKKLDSARWHLTKRQVDKCRRIFGWDPAVRNVLDIRQAMDSTVNCDFFQNMSPFLHMELCAKATFHTVEPGKHMFEQMAAPPIFFVLVVRGQLTWTYHDPRAGEKVRLCMRRCAKPRCPVG